MRTVRLALVAAGYVAQATAAPAACFGLAETADGFAKETAVSRAQRALQDYVNQYRAENNAPSAQSLSLIGVAGSA